MFCSCILNVSIATNSSGVSCNQNERNKNDEKKNNENKIKYSQQLNTCIHVSYGIFILTARLKVNKLNW